MGNKRDNDDNKAASNSDSAEIAAKVTAAAPAPAPLVALALSDPDALENVKLRSKQSAARKGRASLRIPLSSAAGATGGIAIPV